MVPLVILGWRCPVCGSSGRVPCPVCHAQLVSAGPLPCFAGLDWCAALLSYRGVGRELVARAKFGNQRTALVWLGRGMAELVRAQGLSGGVDLVTFAPADPSHVRQRGFDHGQVLARIVARRLNLPVCSELRRGPGLPLTGRSAGQRRGGPPLAPRRRRAKSARSVAAESVLLVDDVITTGATISAAASVLREMGAASVVAVAAAYTPNPAARAEIVTKLPGRAR